MTLPAGAEATPGVVHLSSPYPVDETVKRLRGAVDAAGAKVFAVIDQDAEAAGAGLSLRPTRLVLFGSPAAGTPVMRAAPVSALDLPLKILVWAADDGAVWMSCLAASWLAGRYGLADDLAAPLAAAENLCRKVAAGP